MMLLSMKHQEVILENSIAEFFRSTLRPAIDRVPINDLHSWDRGLRPDPQRLTTVPASFLEAYGRAENLLAHAPELPVIHHEGEASFFRIHEDAIYIPHRSRFLPGAYYQNLFHEISHSTAAPKRLNRRTLLGILRFSDPRAFALEESIAELTSIYLLSLIEMPGCLNRSARFLSYWLRQLISDDLHEILGEAQRAVDYLMPGATAIKTAAAG